MNVTNKKCENAYDYLNSSPMFKFSLSSKELFHSNFIEWLSNVDPERFKKMIEAMAGIKSYNWPDVWRVKREYKNFDVCIVGYDKNKDNNDPSIDDSKDFRILFIIENKVKSIPYQEQLVKYTNKAVNIIGDVHYILLSLAKHFPGKTGRTTKWKLDNGTEWRICHYDAYKQLIETFYLKDKSIDAKTRLYIEDYCGLVNSLVVLSEEWFKNDWKGKDKFLYYSLSGKRRVFSYHYNKVRRLRIHDLYQKLKFSYLCTRLYEDVKKQYGGYTVFASNQGGLFKDNDQEGWGTDKKYICVNYTYMHGEPLLEINLHPECPEGKDEIYYAIQIQGDAYEHGIQVKGRKSGKVWEELTDGSLKIIPNWMTVSGSVWSSMGPIDSKKPYNKYDDPNGTYVYQKCHLKGNETIDEVLDLMKNDLALVAD